MLSVQLVEQILNQARAGGADFAEIYAERRRKHNLRLLNGKVEEATSGIELGAGLRLFFGLDVVYSYTNDLSPASLEELVETLVRLKGSGGHVDSQGRGGLDFRKHTARGLHAPVRPLTSQDKRFRVERLLEAEAATRFDPAVRTVETQLVELTQAVLVANSEGLWVEDDRVRTRLMVQVIAQDQRGTQTGTSAPGLSVGLELFDHFPPDRVGREAAEQALANLRGRPAPAGTMPVVIGNAFGGVIFHEALGHLLETTSVAKKVSVLTDKLGETVASPAVTYIDDGTLPHGWGSSEFDDEGTPSERTVLIENGVLKSYLVDRLGSLQTGYQATGSGRRQDYTYAPASRMRNTFIAAGAASKEALFEGIDHGLYARSMGGGQVLPGSGEYNFSVREGYLIEHGRVTEPVRGAMLVGKGPESIKKIVAVAGDLENAPGMCGSISGMVPVEVGQPHLLVSEIIVGGEA